MEVIGGLEQSSFRNITVGEKAITERLKQKLRGQKLEIDSIIEYRQLF